MELVTITVKPNRIESRMRQMQLGEVCEVGFGVGEMMELAWLVIELEEGGLVVVILWMKHFMIDDDDDKLL